MRKPMIAGNWKMNTTIGEAVNLVKEIQPELDSIRGIEKIICPPFISLFPVYQLIKGTQIILGAQNLYFEEKGAYTGEISPLMLSGFCEYVIVGHSERRHYFHESNELISRKVLSAIDHNLKPILCVGENLDEYESGITGKIVRDQIINSLKGVTNVEDLTIAYEPVWAIGTGKAATGEQADSTINLIRNIIENIYGGEISKNIRILYGGSVTAANIGEFVSQPDIDGALVGGASLKAGEFISIVKKTAEIKKG